MLDMIARLSFLWLVVVNQSKSEYHDDGRIQCYWCVSIRKISITMSASYQNAISFLEVLLNLAVDSEGILPYS
jgi:hypothetical protein